MKKPVFLVSPSLTGLGTKQQKNRYLKLVYILKPIGWHIVNHLYSDMILGSMDALSFLLRTVKLSKRTQMIDIVVEAQQRLVKNHK